MATTEVCGRSAEAFKRSDLVWTTMLRPLVPSQHSFYSDTEDETKLDPTVQTFQHTAKTLAARNAKRLHSQTSVSCTLSLRLLPVAR